MTPAERWLATLWPLVRDRLPAPPARVVDFGCGPLGGFMPMLRPKGYDAVGIDPQAPEQPHYRRGSSSSAPNFLRTTRSSPPPPSIASPIEPMSLTASPARLRAVARSSSWSGPGKSFDEQTAAWCFERLDQTT